MHMKHMIENLFFSATNLFDRATTQSTSYEMNNASSRGRFYSMKYEIVFTLLRFWFNM